MFRTLYNLSLAGLLLVTAANTLHAAEKQDKDKIKSELQAQEVRDLRYGQTLFHYYQKKYFSAITDLMVARQRRPISVQGEDPELLLGGLYLAYGMHNDAGKLFQQLLDENTLPQTHDRAWYYIAKLRYLKGNYPLAEQALQRIKDTLPKEREAERIHLLSNIYISLGQYEKAIEILKDFDGDSEWEAYAKFNLGVALVKAGQLEEGTDLLDDIGDLNPFSISHELNGLRDKANLALGFAYMRGNRPTDAAEHFQRVRLRGPLSNKALLGIGWSYTNQEKYQNALTPWVELQNRPSLDPSVQESLIATPYIIEKLEKKRLAMQNYQNAIDNYSSEINQLENVMKAVQGGELIHAMRPANLKDEASLPLHAFGLPDSITSPYLHQMMATNIFQEAYKNYQSLLHLEFTLKHWLTQLPSYELILAERRKTYFEKLPQVAGDDRLRQINEMQKQRDTLAAKVDLIEREQNAMSMLNEDEQDQFEILEAIRERLERIGNKEDVSEEREKYQILWGIFYFDKNNQYHQRRWQVRKGIIELDKALDKARKAKQSLVRAANRAPRFFEGYNDKILGYRNRISNLLLRLDSAIKGQENYIQSLAMKSLIARRQQLENYHVRARFAIARLYDTLIIERDKAKAAAEDAASDDATQTSIPAETQAQTQAQQPASAAEPATTPDNRTAETTPDSATPETVPETAAPESGASEQSSTAQENTPAAAADETNTTPPQEAPLPVDEPLDNQPPVSSDNSPAKESNDVVAN